MIAYKKTLKCLLFFIVAVSLLNCGNNNKSDNDNIIVLLSNKIDNNELLSNNDFIYYTYNLRNVFYPDTLHTTLYNLHLHSTDTVQEFVCDLQNLIISDTIILSDINSYYIFFNIADKHIQYANKDTTHLQPLISVFGYGILSCLAHSIENNNIQVDTILYTKMENYGYIIPPPTPSNCTKLLRNVKNGNWSYILKRVL